MSYKDTHNLVIDAFGPSMCHDCRRSGSELVAFKCEPSASADADRPTQPKDYNIDKVEKILLKACLEYHYWADSVLELREHDKTMSHAKAQLFELITKEIIGEDEEEVFWNGEEELVSQTLIDRNDLRDEQRQKLSDLFNIKENK